MENTTFTVRTLKAKENLHITQTNLKEGEERQFFKEVFLAKDASIADYRDSSIEESAEYEAKLKKEKELQESRQSQLN